MGKKQTTFHMGDEFNGYGSVRYLKGTKPGHHEPLSQEHVRLSLKPGNYILKVLGSIPVYAGSPDMGPGVGRDAGGSGRGKPGGGEKGSKNRGDGCSVLSVQPE